MTWPPKGVAVNPYAQEEVALAAGQRGKKIANLAGVGGSTHDLMDNGMEVQWKPKSGESTGCAANYNVTWGEQALRETAAYRLAMDAGLEKWVTPTVMRNKDNPYNGEEGCLRLWSPYEPAGGYTGKKDVYDGDGGVAHVAAFDYVSGNGDRHAGNWCYDEKQNHVVMLDHGYCFPNAMQMHLANGNFIIKAQSRFDKAYDEKWSPRIMAEPYVKYKKDILSDLTGMGMNPKAVQGVSERIDDLATKRKWSELKYL
jgi:hypothetical protein